MSARPKSWATRRVYAFIKAHRGQYDVLLMCRALDVTRSGYYAWLHNPLCERAREDARLLRLIRASYAASHGVYGAKRVFLDLREAGETCSKHRVARLMRVNKIKALHGYQTPRYSGYKPSQIAPDLVKRNFDVIRPNKVWVTDITYIRTWQGWLYLAVVMDLFSRMIIGWSAGPNLRRELVLNAVLIAVRRRRPRDTIIHSDQGCQYGSDDWRRFCRTNHLEPSMSRRGNCKTRVVMCLRNPGYSRCSLSKQIAGQIPKHQQIPRHRRAIEMRLSEKRVLRPLAAVFLLLLIGAAANNYLGLGWFGSHARVVMSLTLLANCILLIFSQRADLWKE
jgi:putative transposase